MSYLNGSTLRVRLDGQESGKDGYAVLNWKRLSKYLVTREDLAQYKLLGPFRRWLLDSNLWRMNRDNVGKAGFIGVFCAFIPIPGQMVLAALLAIPSRANLPIALVGSWITNPITVAPISFFCYRVGAWLLNVDKLDPEADMQSWTWIFSKLNEVLWPFLLGSLICACIGGLLAMVVSRLLYRMHVIERIKERRQRRLKRIQDAPKTGDDQMDGTN